MKTLSTLLAIPLLCVLPDGPDGPDGPERPDVRFEAGEALAVDLHTRTENRLAAFRMLQGESVAGEMKTDGTKPSIEERTLRFTDRFVEVDGAPTLVHRTFDQLIQVVTTETTNQVKGELEGRTIALSTAGDGQVQVELEGEANVDPAYLLEHRMPYVVLGLLPERDVAEGEAWEVDGDLAFELLGLVDAAEYFAGETPEKDRFESLLTEIARCGGSAKLERVEERDGEACWVLAYELQIDAGSDDFDLALLGIPRPPGVAKGEMKLEGTGKGTLWIARERRAPVARSFVLEGQLSVSFAKGDLRTEIELIVTHEENQHWRRP